MPILTVLEATSFETFLSFGDFGPLEPSNQNLPQLTFQVSSWRVRLNGTDLNWVVASNAPSGGGTVTSIDILSADGTTVYQTITGVSVALRTMIQGVTNGDGVLVTGPQVALEGNDTLNGSSNGDILRAYSGNDTIDGFGGADVLSGWSGADTIRGGAGNDRLNGGSGDDTLDGGDDDDTLYGDAGADILNGGNGNDLMFAGSSADYNQLLSLDVGGLASADGGAGVDWLYVNLSNLTQGVTLDWRNSATVNTLPNGITLRNIERYNIVLGAGDDVVYDGSESDAIWTGEGNDTVYYGGGTGYGVTIDLGGGDDVFVVSGYDRDHFFNGGLGLAGGSGNDYVVWDASSFAAAFTLDIQTIGFERINFVGTTFGDVVTGGSGADLFLGGQGSDTFTGNGGNDAALFTLGRANYFVRSYAYNGQIVTQVAGPGAEGTDTLASIETLGFNSGQQAFGLAGVQQNLVSNMDGDRFDDVLYQNSSTGQIAYLNMSASGAAGFGNVLGSLPTGWRLIGSDDFTGDGRADALVQNTNDGSIYTINIASGSPVWGVVSVGLTSNFQAIATGDVTRDGTADVLVRDTSGQLYIADIDAGGAFGGWVAGPNLGTGWRTVGLGDFNGNGTSDVLMQNIADGTTYYRDVGNGVWGLVSGAVGPQWVAREAADLNGDSYADVVFRNVSTGDIWWANMLGGSNAGWNVVANGLSAWDVRGSADVDNDGYRDVIVQNTSDGTTYFADMNNGVFVTWGVVTGALGTQWAAVA